MVSAPTGQDQTLQELRQFQSQSLALLKQLQSNRVVDAESKAYQQSLENILNEITGILKSGTVSKKDSARLDSLIDSSEKQYDVMKASGQSDRAFQRNFVKVFGTTPMTGSLAKAIAQSMAVSLKQFSAMVKQATAPIAKNARETALNYATGPFGAMAEQAINFGAIKQYFSSTHQARLAKRQGKRQQLTGAYASAGGQLDNSLKGMFAGGATNIPDSGSYYLHRGERVVAPEQNTDLTDFLEKIQPGTGASDKTPQGTALESINENVSKINKILGVEIAADYFDPVVENDDRLFIITQKDRMRFSKRLFDNLQIIQLGVFNMGQTMYGGIIKLVLGVKRFMRHPLFYSLDFLTKPIQHMGSKLFHEFFGHKADEEERIYDVLSDIYEFMTDREKKHKKSGVQILMKKFFETTMGGPINLLIKALGGKAFTLKNAQRVQERIEKEGKRRGIGGLSDRLHLMGYGEYLNYNYAGGPGGGTPEGETVPMEKNRPIGTKTGRHFSKLMQNYESTLKHFYVDSLVKPFIRGQHGIDTGLHNFLFGELGQKRNAKGQFLPHTRGLLGTLGYGIHQGVHGLFEHAKKSTVGKKTLDILKKIHKATKGFGFFSIIAMLLGSIFSFFKSPLGMATVIAAAIAVWWKDKETGSLDNPNTNPSSPKSAAVGNVIDAAIDYYRGKPAAFNEREDLKQLDMMQNKAHYLQKQIKDSSKAGFFGRNFMGENKSQTQMTTKDLAVVNERIAAMKKQLVKDYLDVEYENASPAEKAKIRSKNEAANKQAANKQAEMKANVAGDTTDSILKDIEKTLKQMLPPAKETVNAIKKGSQIHAAAAVHVAQSAAAKGEDALNAALASGNVFYPSPNNTF